MLPSRPRFFGVYLCRRGYFGALYPGRSDVSAVLIESDPATLSTLNAFVETAYCHLEDGEPVYLDGFGTFKPGLSVENGEVVAKKINMISSVQMKERLRSFLLLEEIAD